MIKFWLLQWSQNSNIACRQTVTVCGFEVGPQANWLITQYISTGVNTTLLPQISVLLEFFSLDCTDLRCQRNFSLRTYETSTEDDALARDLENYQLVTQVAVENVTADTKQNITIEIDLDGDAEGLYLAIMDQTTCIVITRILVFYTVHTCPGGVVNFTRLPETMAPLISQPLRVNASCVPGASPESSEGVELTCLQGGLWDFIPGSGCQCDPGFIAAENGSSCTGV